MSTLLLIPSVTIEATSSHSYQASNTHGGWVHRVQNNVISQCHPTRLLPHWGLLHSWSQISPKCTAQMCSTQAQRLTATAWTHRLDKASAATPTPNMQTRCSHKHGLHRWGFAVLTVCSIHTHPVKDRVVLTPGDTNTNIQAACSLKSMQPRACLVCLDFFFSACMTLLAHPQP